MGTIVGALGVFDAVGGAGVIGEVCEGAWAALAGGAVRRAAADGFFEVDLDEAGVTSAAKTVPPEMTKCGSEPHLVRDRRQCQLIVDCAVLRRGKHSENQRLPVERRGFPEGC
ncbi:hypothetical protein K2X89_05295 [Myxococcota bacterium]|nr:hypothetical protein [Myxococcota bacterium]